MLHNYTDMLQKAFETMISLGGSDATWSDYFYAVGFEILTLVVGLIYILVCVLIITVPILGCRKIWKGAKANTAYKQHLEDIRQYNEFIDVYMLAKQRLKIANKEKARKAIYEEILRKLDSVHIPYEEIDLSTTLYIEAVDKLPYLPYILDNERHIDLPGDFANITNPGKYITFGIMQWFPLVKNLLLSALLVIIYFIFVIPLVLMLI